ncbi:hypothetical protein D9M71_833230 [compost metagenome]
MRPLKPSSGNWSLISRSRIAIGSVWRDLLTALAMLRTAIHAAKSRSFIQRPARASKRFCSWAAP